MSITHQFKVSDVPRSWDIDISQNIIKRRESIIYSGALSPAAANLAYITTPLISVENNLSIADRSTSLPANRIFQSNYVLIDNNDQFTVETDNFEVTDVFLDSSETITPLPLFKKHLLQNFDPDTETLLGYQILDVDWNPLAVTSAKMDTSIGYLFHNLAPVFHNELDYKVYYLRYAVRTAANAIHVYIELLNSTPVYRQATFDDLAEDLSLIQDGRKVYLIEETIYTNNFTITLPIDNDYAYRVLARSKLSIKPPQAISVADPWYVSVTNGKVYTTISGVSVKYSISDTEFLAQTFSEVYGPPIRHVTSELSTILSRSLVKLDRQDLYEDSSSHVSVLINDASNTGIAALTTDPALSGTLAANDVLYQRWTITSRVGIRSVDRVNGLLDIDGIQLESTYLVFSDYDYAANDYEFTSVNFNPVSNRNATLTTTTLFNDPDFVLSGVDKEQKLYYLTYNMSGRVLESDYPSFDNDTQLWNGEQMYYESVPDYINPSGVVLFVDEYTTEGSPNNYKFLVLGDIHVAEAGGIKDVDWIDTRKRGGGISDLYIEDALALSPDALNLWDQSTWDGLPYPGTANFFVEVPIELLEGAGGVFKSDEIVSIVNRHTALGVAPLVKGYGIDITYSGIDAGDSTITIYWNGHEYN
jgi:hypothetical protein